MPVIKTNVKDVSLRFGACLLAIIAGLFASAGVGAVREQLKPKVPPPLLMFVRAWNPATGELIGWLPMNRVAITLVLLPGQSGVPKFGVNSAVSVRFPYRPGSPVKYGRLHVASKVVTLEGRQYILAPVAPNLVRIGKIIFYVKTLDFGDSKWREPTVIAPARPSRPRS